MVQTNEELEISFHHLELEFLELKSTQAKIISELITAWKKTGFYKND